ncbi:MAG: hemerythrin family protein [Magnetococcus sp. WYHC-3]
MLWQSGYAIGHPVVDAQHRELFRRLGLVIELLDDDQPEDARSMLHFLAEYVDEHFTAEERLMAEVGYPQMERHARIHRNFRQQVLELMNRATDMPDQRLEDEVIQAVSSWLVDHILGEDRKIGDFLGRKALQGG